jgi:hypothetical protein
MMQRFVATSKHVLANAFINNRGSFTSESLTPGSVDVSQTGYHLMVHHRESKTYGIVLEKYIAAHMSTRNSIQVLILVLCVPIMVCYIKRFLISGVFNYTEKHQELVMEYEKRYSCQIEGT